MTKIYKYTLWGSMRYTLFASFLFLLSAASKNTFLLVTGSLILIVMARDSMRMRESFIQVTDEGIKEMVKTREKAGITWKEVEYVSRTRQNPKWIIVGSAHKIVTLKPQLENFDELKKDLLERYKQSGKVYIHHSIR